MAKLNAGCKIHFSDVIIYPKAIEIIRIGGLVMTKSVAQELWNARVNNTKLASDFAGGPETEDEAYKIQEEMIAASGLAVTGWKIGATVEELFQRLGVSQPFLGPLFKRFTHDSGSELRVLPGHSIETEMTVRLQTDLVPREQPYNRAEIEKSIAAIHPSFEIVGARFEGELAGAGFRLIADGGANIGTVLGKDVGIWSDLDLANYPLTLSINGELVQEGNTSVLLWDHIFDALSWCLQHPVLAQRGLRAGDLIMTGTCTGITPISSGDKAVANFGSMGEVSVSFN